MTNPAVTLTLFLICASASFHGYAQSQSGSLARDTTIHIQGDISGCGVSDSIFYLVTADRLGNPLFWALTIEDCGGNILFYHSACACESDEFFGSEDYIVRRTYEGTRRDWFFVDLPGRLITKRRFSQDSGIFDRNNSASIYRVARNFLMDKFQVSLEKASELTEALALKVMKEEVTLLTIYKNPSEHSDPMIFLKEIRQFVPIGQW